MCVRILIIITKRPLRHATEVDVSVAKTLGQSVTKRLDHNKLNKSCCSLNDLDHFIFYNGYIFIAPNLEIEKNTKMAGNPMDYPP